MGSTEPSSLPRPAAPSFTADSEVQPANPFFGDVCSGPLGLADASSVPGLNAEVLAQLRAAVDQPAAPLILLTAPRAGFGKTHLLGRLAAVASADAILVPLVFRSGDAVTLATVCRRSLEALHQGPGPNPRWTRLREIHAGIVAALVHTLIEDGMLACANPDQALRVLSGSVIEIFDDEGSALAIGDWLRKYRNQLLPPMTALAARHTPVRQEVLGAWIEVMLDHAVDGAPAGLAAMLELAASDADSNIPAWLRLVSLWRQPILLVDHLDGFHRNVEAGVSIAALLMDLADSHGVHVLLSINQDVWHETFGSHLPSALEDRLTTSRILLRGLNVEESRALVELRLQAAGISIAEASEFIDFLAIDRFFMGRPLGSVSARAFLRQAARQWDIFKNSVPPPPDASDPAATIRNFRQRSDSSSIPLVTETVDLEETPKAGPTIFDPDTGTYVKELAAGLAGGASKQPGGEWTNPPPAGAPESNTGQPTADAFVKLREMLGRLRQPSPSGEPTVEAAREAPSAAKETQPGSPPSPRSDALLGRFEALRLQMSAEADSQPLDFTKLAELIRLAGRRFPLVRFSEHELPGMTGRNAMCWSLQGAEIFFGLANFMDRSYWRTLSAFAAGRLAEQKGEGNASGESTTRLKLVTFKSDREQAGFQAMLDGGVIPEGLRGHLDAIHLDSGSVASLYAMQRIIKEAETGALQVEPAQVMSALARELDFFWKRVTRVG